MQIRMQIRLLGRCALSMLALATWTHAAVITIQPSVQDTFVQQDSPKRISGAGPQNVRIRVQSSPTTPARWRGFVQFDLSGIPQFSTINSATLTIYQSVGKSGRTHGIHVVTAPWLQSVANWNTQPAYNPVPTATFPTLALKGPQTATVTANVQAWVNAPATNHGWAVVDENETSGTVKVEVPYHAKEESQPGELANRPKLVIDFTATPCNTTQDCLDNNPCTVNERCVTNFCFVDPLDCNDGSICTDDICDPSQGCLHPPICNDGLACTVDTCDEGTGACTNTPDDVACTAGGCKVGTCEPNDPGADDDGCVITAINPDGTPCNDGLFCQSSDTCLGGACQGTARDCSDPNPCTADSCNEATDTCVHDPAPLNGSACNDSLFCTVGDLCQAGSCQGTPRNCSDTNPCTADSCNEAGDVCVNNPGPLNGTACNDNLFCTTGDTCQAGACQGAARDCSGLDGPCTDGVCSEGTDQCVAQNHPNGSSCDDGQCGTIDDTCSGGVCSGTPSAAGCIDPFLCYKTRAVTPFVPVTVQLVNGAFNESGGYLLRKGRHLCTPASANGAAIRDDDTHLRSYLMKPAPGTAKHQKRSGIQVTNQLGSLSLRTIRQDFLLVPSAKSLAASPPAPNPAGHEVDHFVCYKAKISAGAPKFPKGLTAQVADQFISPAKTFSIKKVRHLCLPVDKNGEGVKHSDTRLVCYLARPGRGQPKHVKRSPVYTNNQLAPETIGTVREDVLCLPSQPAGAGTTTSTVPGSTTTSSSVSTSTSSTTSTSLPSSTTTSVPSPSTTTTSGAPTTTTSSSTTSSTISSCSCGSPTPTQVSFTTATGSGNCGTVKNSSGTTLLNLTCGTLYFGGGFVAVPPSVPPDKGVTIANASCTGTSLTLSHATAAQTGSIRNCSAAGCLFGAPLAVPNPSSPGISNCIVNTITQDGFGSADCVTGAMSLNIPLASALHLTGDWLNGSAPDRPDVPGVQPCPLCSGSPGSETCQGGPNHGLACTPETSGSGVLGAAYPTSQDCPPPPGPFIGILPVAFALTTGSAGDTAFNSQRQQRVFCGYCNDFNDTGGFGLCSGGANDGDACLLQADCPGGTCGGAKPCQSDADCRPPISPGEPRESCQQRTGGAFGQGGAQTITQTGTPFGNLTDHAPHNGTMVTVFCIPPTFNSTVDGAAGLPGPGTVSIPGLAELLP